MATAPIRPKAYANWLTEVTATSPAPADARRHALCLFGQAAQLFTRWCPTVLAPELCNRQTFVQYDETVLESIAASTHLLVVRDCDVSAVWRDRKAIEDALRDIHIVFLFPEQQARTNTRCWFLAERLGMTAAGSLFSCVDAMDLYKREERVDQPPMKLTMPGDADSQMVTVEASATVLKRRLEQFRREAPDVLAEAAARRERRAA